MAIGSLKKLNAIECQAQPGHERHRLDCHGVLSRFPSVRIEYFAEKGERSIIDKYTHPVHGKVFRGDCLVSRR